MQRSRFNRPRNRPRFWLIWFALSWFTLSCGWSTLAAKGFQQDDRNQSAERGKAQPLATTPFKGFSSHDSRPRNLAPFAETTLVKLEVQETPNRLFDPASYRSDELEILKKRLAAVEQELANRKNSAAADASNKSASEIESNSPPTSGSESASQAPAELAKKSQPKVNGLADNAQSKPLADSSSKSEPKPATEPDIPSDKWDVKLGGHIQMDYITWADADPAISGAQNYFNYRRLRLVADGVGYDQFDFRLQMTLEPGEGLNASPQATPDVKDAYLTINEISGIGRIRLGNFFVPFSLEQVTNDTNNIFNERSIPTQNIFAADREVGIAFYNQSLDQSLSWSSGLFFDSLSDTIKTRFGDRQGYRLSGRLNWVPYYCESEDKRLNGRYLVHTGIGILHTDAFNDQIRFRARPQVQRGPILIDSGNLAASSHTTAGLEFAVVWGRITIQNEAFLSQVNQLSGQALHAGGAYSHLSYFMTGENRIYDRFGQHGAQFGRNRPYQNLSLRQGCQGWGAWEAKVRWSYLDLTDAGAGQYNDISSGFNWYWSDRTRVMFDWIHPYTSDDTVFGSTSSDLLAIRLDVNW